jgi:maltooligosyltrehalose trehalohydrolase
VNPDRAKLGAALTILAPYVPLLFQGEEWNASSPFQYFVDFAAEPELARAVSVGRRNEFRHFGWKPEDVPDPQDPQTFRRSKLDWREVSSPAHRSMFDWYRQLTGS